MQARLRVVHPVESVVEVKPVEHPSDEVARVVVGVLDVAAVMPEVVHGRDAPHGAEMRHEHEKKCLLPIQDGERDLDAPGQKDLDVALRIPVAPPVLRERCV